MAALLNLQVKNSLEALQSANKTMSGWLRNQKVSDEVQHFASLAMEEFITNVIKYGYDDSEEHLIEVSLRLSDVELALTFVDGGRPFNPLQVPEPNLELPIEERPIGGLGIYLLRTMADEMTYVREKDKNRVELHKKIAERKPKDS